MKRGSVLPDHDPRAKNDHRQLFRAVHLHQNGFGGGFGARIVIPPHDCPIERGLFCDRASFLAGIIGSNRSGINQPLDPSLEAGFGNEPCRLDVVLEIIIPGLRMSAGQMEYKFNSTHKTLEVCLRTHVATNNFEMVAIDLFEH